MKIDTCALFSGSDGNSIYVGDSHGAMLFDAGRNAKQLEIAMKYNNLDSEKIHSIFITHEHSDHVSALSVFAKKHKFKVYGSKGTINELLAKGILENIEHEIVDLAGIKVEGAFVQPFRISHDCAEGFGYTIEMDEGSKIAVCSDLGCVSEEIISALRGSDIVFIESNHDVEMLKNGAYPYYLKKRILSEKGHLSNESCAEILTELYRSGTRKFVLSHLSKENNTEKIAYTSAYDSLCKYGAGNFMLDIAPRVAGY